ncbi:ATP-binding protein [Actinomadura sp. LOL_011]|uniref:ATP-binding protein n=1 Tax=Actinomadura sp. LOL_011 TaxID=3345410 RepID=UPI003A808D21
MPGQHPPRPIRSAFVRHVPLLPSFSQVQTGRRHRPHRRRPVAFRTPQGVARPPPVHADELKIDRPDLYWLRAYVAEYARRTPLPDEDLQRLLVAVTEVVTNAERHGAPPIVLRMWTDGARFDPAFVCEVADGGRWPPDAGFGLVPPRRSEAGTCGRFGLWAVRLLCSLVQIRTGPAGTVVRLRLALPPGFGDGG